MGNRSCDGLNLWAEISKALGIDGFLMFFMFIFCLSFKGHLKYLKIGFGESREPIPSTAVPKFFKFNQIYYYY